MTPSTPLLQVRDLRVDVGERTVLRSVHLDVAAGSLVVLITVPSPSDGFTTTGVVTSPSAAMACIRV